MFVLSVGALLSVLCSPKFGGASRSLDRNAAYIMYIRNLRAINAIAFFVVVATCL